MVQAYQIVSKHKLTLAIRNPIALDIWIGGLILDCRQADGAEE